jgi:hypothetical protein
LKSAVVSGVPTSLTASGVHTLTTGTLISGAYTDTLLDNGTYLVFAPVTPAVGGFGLDLYLPFTLTSSQRINSLFINGRYQNGSGNLRYCNIYLYNWTTLAWDQISDAANRMNHSTSDSNFQYTMLPAYQDTDGSVRIGFKSPSTTTTDRLYIDQVLVNVVTSGATAGEIADAVYLKMRNTVYDGSIHIDTNNGYTGVDIGINGIYTHKSSNYADAITLADLLHIQCFELAPDSLIVLQQSHANWCFDGKGYIDLNGQDISDVIFNDCEGIYGVSTGVDADFHDCTISSATLYPFKMTRCILSEKITLGGPGNYTLLDCVSGIPGLSTPEIQFGTGAYYVGFRNYSGGIRVSGMTTDCRMTLEGNGQIKISSDCTGGTIAIRGNFTITDEVVGGFQGTISDSARFAEDQAIAEISNIPSNGSSFSAIGDTRLENLDFITDTVAKEASVTTLINTLNDMESKLLEMYQLYGLDPTKPLTVELEERRAGLIRQSIITDPNTETTVVTRI